VFESVNSKVFGFAVDEADARRTATGAELFDKAALLAKNRNTKRFEQAITILPQFLIVSFVLGASIIPLCQRTRPALTRSVARTVKLA